MSGYIKRIAWLSTLQLGCLVLAVSAQGASFDCGKASTKVEHLICDSPEISKLDNELGQVYQDVLSKADEEQKQQVINEQKHWLKFTRNVCEKNTCLKHAYWSRQAALETYFEPRSPVYEHEAGKSEAIKQVLATAPFNLLEESRPAVKQFCNQIFDDLKTMNGIRFVDPVVQVQSYEDPALDPWKMQCQSEPPFTYSYECERNIKPTNADDVVEVCQAGYGLPPFKLYELPPVGTSGEKRHFFYADDAYGPMNQNWRKPHLGGGFAGFKQIHIAKCLSASGNHWERGGKKRSSWRAGSADAGQGRRNGKNYNSIIEYKNQHYFLILNEKIYGFRLDIEPTEPSTTVCNWFPDTK